MPAAAERPPLTGAAAGPVRCPAAQAAPGRGLRGRQTGRPVGLLERCHDLHVPLLGGQAVAATRPRVGAGERLGVALEQRPAGEPGRPQTSEATSPSGTTARTSGSSPSSSPSDRAAWMSSRPLGRPGTGKGDGVPPDELAGPVDACSLERPPDRLGWVVVVAGLMSPEPRGPLASGAFRSGRTRAPVPASSGSMYGTEGTPGAAAGRVLQSRSTNPVSGLV